MIEYYIQTEKNWSVVDSIVPEITKNPETRDYKNKQNNLPKYGIVSLIIIVIGIVVVLFNFNNISISFATPILLVSVIIAGEGINVDLIRGTSIIGLIVGIVFLIISLSPVILYVADIFVH